MRKTLQAIASVQNESAGMKLRIVSIVGDINSLRLTIEPGRLEIDTAGC